MRTVGSRTEHPITFHASGELLKQGALFNDGIHGLPSGRRTGVKKGVYRFTTLEEKNRFDETCVAESIASVRAERRSG
jgi:hypothetical protein